MNQDSIIKKMICNEAPYVRLHPDIIPEDLEKALKKNCLRFDKKEVGDGAGICYTMDGNKFYYGAITRHPSMRMSPVIAA